MGCGLISDFETVGAMGVLNAKAVRIKRHMSWVQKASLLATTGIAYCKGESISVETTQQIKTVVGSAVAIFAIKQSLKYVASVVEPSPNRPLGLEIKYFRKVGCSSSEVRKLERVVDRLQSIERKVVHQGFSKKLARSMFRNANMFRQLTEKQVLKHGRAGFESQEAMQTLLRCREFVESVRFNVFMRRSADG